MGQVEARITVTGTEQSWEKACRRLRAVMLAAAVVGSSLSAQPAPPPPTSAPSPAAASSTPVSTSEGTLPDGMTWRIVLPEKWNGALILDLDFLGGGIGTTYPVLYGRGFAAAGIHRIPFEQGGRDSRVSARQLTEVLDIFTRKYGKPRFTIMNGGSTGGTVSGYTLEHYPDRIDGAVANCMEPGYLPYLLPRLNALFAAKVFFDIDLPIVSHPGTTLDADTAAWRARIDAAQATPEGKARIALALALGQMNTWTSSTLPPPDTQNLDQVQAYMYDTLRNLYAFDVGARMNRERQIGGKSFTWTTGFDYARMFRDNIRPEQRAAILKFYRQAGLDLRADLRRLNKAPRIAADPAAVAEVHSRGDYSGKPQGPILLNNLIGDPLVQTAATQGYLDRARQFGKGDLVRLTYVAGAGHCRFRPNETAAAIETMHERLRTGVWPGTSAAAMNARAAAIDPAQTPRFVEYKDPPFAGGFWSGDVYTSKWRPR